METKIKASEIKEVEKLLALAQSAIESRKRMTAEIAAKYPNLCKPSKS